MTELLILKAEGEYFKFHNSSFTRCTLNKATVFPLTQVEIAQDLQRMLQDNGVSAAIMKLTISETLYME